MMHTPSGGPYQIASWPKQDIKAHIAFMVGFAKKLGESGELVSAEGLAAPDQAKRVRAGKDGKPITDGIEVPGLGKAAVDVAGKQIKVDKIMRIDKDTIDGLIAAGL